MGIGSFLEGEWGDFESRPEFRACLAPEAWLHIRLQTDVRRRQGCRVKATWFKQSCAEDRSAVHAGLKVMARRKYYFEDEETAFSLVEEHGFYRLRVERSAIEDKHVEEFLDRTVEWLSRNPDKGILIDFKGVKSVCNEFAIHLRHVPTST